MTVLKNIITIQHPESIHHTNGMIGSWTDWELSEKGIEQADNVACNLQLEIKKTHFRSLHPPLKEQNKLPKSLEKSWIYNLG